MIVETATGREQFTAARFETDEHNNLCIFAENNRCNKVYAAGYWVYAEVENG